MISSCNTNFASCDVFQVLTLNVTSDNGHSVIHTLYSDRTLHSRDGISPHADLYFTFLRY